MTWTNQLVVHEDIEMADQLSAAIGRALGEKADVITARSIEEASNRIGHPNLSWSLIVVSANARKARDYRPSGDSTEAQEFIRVAHREQTGVPIIALSVRDDAGLEGLLRGLDEDTALVTCKPDFLAYFEAMVRDLDQKRPVRPTQLELEITMLDGDSGAWRIRRRGRVGGKLEGDFAINSKTFSRLVNFSAAIPKTGDTWSQTMELACEQVEKLLFEGYDNDLSNNFFFQCAQVGGTENIRVLFTMTPSRQNAMVEALRDRMGARDFWMLKAPIVRQYTIAGNNRPIFADPASKRCPANCLVVNANPARSNEDSGLPLVCDALPEISGEASDIVAILEKASRDQQGIGEVRRLDLSLGQDDPAGELLGMLERKRWDLVHFAGHSFVSENGEPNLVLDPAVGAVLDFQTLVEHLKHTRFLFVSSCKSADHSFITKAIDSVIPAVLGYRWKVDDKPAATFARSFYQSLFKLGEASFQSIDYAFLAARRATHKANPANNAWASPMLLTQLQQ